MMIEYKLSSSTVFCCCLSISFTTYVLIAISAVRELIAQMMMFGMNPYVWGQLP